MPGHVELIIENAGILTMDAVNPRAEAIAVGDGLILAVGSRVSVLDLRGPATKVIDARGATVLPGFIEAHMHLFSGAAELAHMQLSGVSGYRALEKAIRSYAAERPDDVLIGQSVDYTVLEGGERLTRHHLDSILASRPLILAAPDHHTMWANTMALEMAGLLHGRNLPPGNEIVMAADGLAEGELRENEAFGPVLALGGSDRPRLGLSTGGEPDPPPSAADRAGDRAILRRGLAWCARHGITSIQNMDGNLYQLELLSEIEAEGGLLCRVQIPFHFKNFMRLGMLDKASAMARQYAGEWLSSGMVKVFFDGVLDSWTAYMIEPYADRAGWRGEPLFSDKDFAELAIEADRRGLQIAVHAIGDGAVRAVLDGYEKARRVNGARDSRHRIEHIEVTTQADIARFAELGVIVSVQPPHPPGAMGFPLEPTLSRIGRDRWPFAYPYKSLKDAGAHVVFASDWPVAPIDPISGIQAAMLRQPWANDMPSQRFTLHEAIASYTVEGAYAAFMEHRKGVLKAGFLADLVMLSGDIEHTDPAVLHHVHPLLTVCGGKVIYAG